MALNSFSFLVLAYNHEKYIIEHLESIKYQVLTYGEEMSVDILISDDFSKDRTVDLIEKWIFANKRLFNRIIFKFNNYNLGTCSCVVNLINCIETKYFKLTAGDDVYSFENIFKASLVNENIAFISGFPLYIENNKLSENFLSNVLIIATKLVYKKKGIGDQFVNFSFNNAPNMVYNLNYIKDNKVIDFIKKFDVTEDWPIQLAISKYYPNNNIKYLDKVLVYYRRTIGSTYIVANSRFVNDKLKIFEFLISNSLNKFSKLRIESRLLAFKYSKYFISKIINLDLIIFFLEVLLRIIPLISHFSKLNLKKYPHSAHLEFIQRNATLFNNSFQK